MKHLIETIDSSSLPIVEYDRLIPNSNTNDVLVRGGANANGHPYVDLGLPSGLKWATMNVGAETETDYGDYFMWGSTTPDTDNVCSWTTCPFNNKSSSYDSGYFDSVKDTVCPNGILAKKYDVAAQVMGGDWRMPTKAEFYELTSNTTIKRITDYNGSTVNGYKLIGSNGNSIFIPASGYREDSSFYGQGSEGCVWGSSLWTLCPNNAYYLRVYLDEDYDPTASQHTIEYRYFGHTVRGVL